MASYSVLVVGGVCALVMGALYVGIAVAYQLLPAEQQGEMSSFLTSFREKPLVATSLYWLFALLGGGGSRCDPRGGRPGGGEG